MRMPIVAVLFYLLAGCASIETDPARIQRAETYQPTPGMASVYVIRDMRAYPTMDLGVTITKLPREEGGFADTLLLKLNTFARMDVEPGLYELRSIPMTFSMFDQSPGNEVNLAPEQLYFYRLAPEQSFSGTVFFMDEVPAADAMGLIKERRMQLVTN